MEVNTTAPFAFTFGKNGASQKVVVNWPTDDQWVTRAKAGRSLMKNLPGGKTQSLPPSEEALDKADLALFRSIVVEPADPEATDEEYALRIVEILDRGQIGEVTEAGDVFEIELRVLGTMGIPPATTKHTLRKPTFREERKWQNRYSGLVSHQGNRFEIRTDPSFAGEMYDLLKTSVSGYTEGSVIPINHKVPVVSRLMAAARAAEETEVEDENSF